MDKPNVKLLKDALSECDRIRRQANVEHYYLVAMRAREAVFNPERLLSMYGWDSPTDETP